MFVDNNNNNYDNNYDNSNNNYDNSYSNSNNHSYSPHQLQQPSRRPKKRVCC